MFGMALAVAFLVYYNFYLVALITATIPTILNQLLQGKSIGKQTKIGPLSFLVQLVDYFHFEPFVATIAGVVGWLLRRTWTSPIISYTDLAQADDQFTLLNALLYLAWLLTFGLFSILEVKMNLLQKQNLFGLPLFALGFGPGLAAAVAFAKNKAKRFGWLKSLMTVTIAGFVIWFIGAGSYTRFIRVINYVLPAGSG